MRLKFLACLTAASAVAFAFSQTTSAIGVLKQIGMDGSLNVYDLQITNTGSTNIGTLWFAWIPGQDYLMNIPTNFGAPAGWAEKLVSHDFNQGYGIQWQGSALAPGQTLDGFTFESADSLSYMAGNSPFDSGVPVTTSFVYEMGPFQGGSDQFVFQVLTTETITPSAFTVVRGKLISGNLASLAAIDQNYLVVQTGVTINANDPPIQVIVNGTAAQGTASNLEVDLTAHCINGSGQAIDAWNWTTNSYVQIDSRNSTSTDSTVKASIPNPNQYIQPGTDAVRLRIRYFRVSGIVSIAWNAFIDQVIWKLTP